MYVKGFGMNGSGLMSLYLDNADADCKAEKGKPLLRGEFSAEEDNGKSGSGEDLDLIGDLECGSVQIRSGDVLKIVLED